MNLDRTIKWIDKTEGRDKLCKAIQYLCRLLKHSTRDSNKELSQRFHGLFVGMGQARKLFRLFKSVNEYQKIVALLKQPCMDPVGLGLNVATRLGFLLFWVFDNLAILSTIKFLKYDPKGFAKKGATFWLIALVVSALQNLRTLMAVSQQLASLKTSGNMQNDKMQERVKSLQAQHSTSLLNVLKNVADMITASQGSQVMPALTGKNWNDGQCGAGGLFSAVVTSYQLYQ